MPTGFRFRQRFGRLTVKSAAFPSKDGKKRHECLCDCGKTVFYTPEDLANGAISCSSRCFTGKKRSPKAVSRQV